MFKLQPNDALLIVDVQRDFCAGGALAVPKGDEVVPIINRVAAAFMAQGLPIYMSADWHQADSKHFTQWPVHCVQNTNGAKFHPDFDPALLTYATLIVKGNRDGDGYSAFEGDVLHTYAKLLDRLKFDGIKRLVICGLATDYCVKATALDAITQAGTLDHPFEVIVLLDAIRGVDLKPHDSILAISDMATFGVQMELSE